MKRNENTSRSFTGTFISNLCKIVFVRVHCFFFALLLNAAAASTASSSSVCLLLSKRIFEITVVFQTTPFILHFTPLSTICCLFHSFCFAWLNCFPVGLFSDCAKHTHYTHITNSRESWPWNSLSTIHTLDVSVYAIENCRSNSMHQPCCKK